MYRRHQSAGGGDGCIGEKHRRCSPPCQVLKYRSNYRHCFLPSVSFLGLGLFHFYLCFFPRLPILSRNVLKKNVAFNHYTPFSSARCRRFFRRRACKSFVNCCRSTSPSTDHRSVIHWPGLCKGPSTGNGAGQSRLGSGYRSMSRWSKTGASPDEAYSATTP